MLQPRPRSYAKIIILTLIIIISVVTLVIGLKTPLLVKRRISTTELPHPKDIQPFQLTSFTQQNLNRHWTLLFFGYTHCSDICPITLAALKEVYQQLLPLHPNLQVVFISIDPEEDKAQQVKKFVSAFNKNFIGITGTPKQLQQIQQQFSVYVSNSGKTNISHTSSVFLINPQQQWVALFPYGMHPKEIIKEFEKIT